MAEEQATPNPTDPAPAAGAGGAGGGGNAKSDAAAAALAAAQEAIARARAMQDQPAAAQPGAAGSDGGAEPAADGQPAPQPFKVPAFAMNGVEKSPEGIDLLSDVNLQVKIELGRTKMLVEDVLKLAEGAVVELDKLAGDPVDIYVNDRPVARGEVLVLNDNFCVRINEILTSAEGRG
jgi:flagellar motor switch protein FliN/FliY